jgi:hypothetical protein
MKYIFSYILSQSTFNGNIMGHVQIWFTKKIIMTLKIPETENQYKNV